MQDKQTQNKKVQIYVYATKVGEDRINEMQGCYRKP